MNSMFSAFDAMCAEIMGKKVTSDSYVYRSKRNAVSSGGGGGGGQTLKKDEKASDLVTKPPRYALELDGLHCFETIVRS
ncbi:hypothetical protein AALP_AA1G336100 [Arabis alpina]|uniref:Uncharacterized protein n=1 Tax=Arabis alpina TaxID=50452 RepID=A0A087HSD6_ARAAL|nr:hypothetical protein AALP_AA1G336100 [Arabis alpina]